MPAHAGAIDCCREVVSIISTRCPSVVGRAHFLTYSRTTPEGKEEACMGVNCTLARPGAAAWLSDLAIDI